MGDAGGGVHGGEQEHQEPVDRIRDVDPVDTELAHRDGDLIAGVECLKDAALEWPCSGSRCGRDRPRRPRSKHLPTVRSAESGCPERATGRCHVW
jgi:hypothetical protein